MNALITGITGQDGSYLAELLLEKGYKVYGLVRRSSTSNFQRIESILSQINIIYGDITDYSSVRNCIIELTKNEGIYEIYNLAGQSDVKISFENSNYTYDVNFKGVLNIINSVLEINDKIKIYNACTSEMYGDTNNIPQNENTKFNPCSPYAISKYCSYTLCNSYRDNFNLFICNGILFNHESKRRGENFVTRKITLSLKNISNGIPLELGNLNSKRDWGHAKDYVYGMWLMLQHEKPDNYVLSTGIQKTVKQFIESSLYYIGKSITWEGKDEDEIGKDKHGNVIVKINKKYYRPNEVSNLLGDSSKARKILGWNTKLNFDDIVLEMVSSDYLNNRT